MNKTAQQWIEESNLPAEVKAAALANLENHPNTGASINNSDCKSLHNAINGFAWVETEYGWDYWNPIFIHLRNGNDPATSPLPPLKLPAIPWEFVDKQFNCHAFLPNGDGCFYSGVSGYGSDGNLMLETNGRYAWSCLKIQPTDRHAETLQHRPK